MRLVGYLRKFKNENVLFDNFALKRKYSSLSKIEIVNQVHIDSFTTHAFTGNPAKVVFQQSDSSWMQNIATENNIPVSAFVAPISDAPHNMNYTDYDIKWFTPTKEIELCGHATLAAAHALYSTKLVHSDSSIQFRNHYAGLLTAKRTSSGQIQLNFPSTPVEDFSLNSKAMQVLTSALGIESSDVVYIGRNASDLLVEISPVAFNRMDEVDYEGIRLLAKRGVIVTCIGGKHSKRSVENSNETSELSGMGSIVENREYDIILRGFYPRIGINEDSVTGSAMCTLAPYWNKAFRTRGIQMCDKTDSNVFRVYQNSSRGGEASVELIEQTNSLGTMEDRVLITGSCVTVTESVILV